VVKPLPYEYVPRAEIRDGIPDFLKEVPMKTTLAAGIIFGLIALLGIECYAQGTTIQGCYQKNNGQLRIVSTGNACRPSEISISLNTTGPQGPAGPAGPQGPPGEQAQCQQQPITRVYDASEQFLGILPTTWDGYLSVFVPTLSKFIFISPEDGDIDWFYPIVYLYYDDLSCAGNSYVDTSMRYQVFKLDSKYYAAKDAASDCLVLKSYYAPAMGGQCRTRSSTTCISVLGYGEVTLPFTMPVSLPLYFQNQ
jgi:hypothetical protein